MEDSMIKNQNVQLQNFKEMKTIMYLQVRQLQIHNYCKATRMERELRTGVLGAQQSPKGLLCLAKMGKVVLTGLLP